MRLALLPVVLMVAFFLVAAPGGMPVSLAQQTPDQAQSSPVGAFVQSIGNQAIAIMADKSLTREQRTQKYRDILRSAFDMPAIGHFVLGRYWDMATPDQKKTFLDLFEQLVLQAYGDRLNFYTGEGFRVKSVHSESGTDSMVSSEITHPGSEAPTGIDWRVREKDGKFAVLDVIIEGISQSVTERQEYAAIIQRNNGNIQALLDLMKQRLQAPQH